MVTLEQYREVVTLEQYREDLVNLLQQRQFWNKDNSKFW